MHDEDMLKGLIASEKPEETVFVARKFVREGAGSYLVWLPWCSQTPSSNLDFQALFVWNVVDSNSMYFVYL